MQVADGNKLRRDNVRLALVCFVLQLALAPHIALGNGRINFALVFCSLVSLSVGGRRGVAWGFAAGLVYDLCTTGPIGLMALLLTIASFSMGMECRNRLSDDWGSAIVLYLTVSAVVVLVYQIAMLLVGDASSFVDVVFVRALPTFALTALVFVPLSRFAGSGGGPSRRGGKYNIGRI